MCIYIYIYTHIYISDNTAKPNNTFQNSLWRICKHFAGTLFIQPRLATSEARRASMPARAGTQCGETGTGGDIHRVV